MAAIESSFLFAACKGLPGTLPPLPHSPARYPQNPPCNPRFRDLAFTFLETLNPDNLAGFGHEDTAPMLVAIELLCSIEGPMWREVRGLGLAYSFGMHGDADEGLVYFSLSRSSNVPKAFQVRSAMRIVMLLRCDVLRLFFLFFCRPRRSWWKRLRAGKKRWRA